MSGICVDFGPLGPSGKASEPEPEGLPWKLHVPCLGGKRDATNGGGLVPTGHTTRFPARGTAHHIRTRPRREDREGPGPDHAPSVLLQADDMTR
jgi:hypothetical protein